MPDDASATPVLSTLTPAQTSVAVARPSARLGGRISPQSTSSLPTISPEPETVAAVSDRAPDGERAPTPLGHVGRRSKHLGPDGDLRLPYGTRFAAEIADGLE